MPARLGAVLCVAVCIFCIAGCGPTYNGIAKDRATAITLAKKNCEEFFRPFHTPLFARLDRDMWIVSVREGRAWAGAIIDAKTGRPLECRGGTGTF